MSPATWVRARLFSMELMFICHTAFLKRAPVLRRLHCNVTADLTILEPKESRAAAFTVDFRSPYFHFPVPLEKTQIGEVGPDRRLQPTSFRFFDWQTWAHIDGVIEWRGEGQVRLEGEDIELITGFSYRIPNLPPVVGNLGLRLAEGVEGTVRVFCGERIARVQFDPVFWLLEVTSSGLRPVPIKSTKLMGLIVPLFDLGRGDPRVLDSAVDRLQRWAELNLDDRKPFRPVVPFLTTVRRWAPLGMEPMFRGVGMVLTRLQISDLERHLFDFFADNWGVRGSRDGRLLAVKLLEALGTERARTALQAISDLVTNQGISSDELDLIRGAAGKVETNSERSGHRHRGD